MNNNDTYYQSNWYEYMSRLEEENDKDYAILIKTTEELDRTSAEFLRLT